MRVLSFFLFWIISAACATQAASPEHVVLIVCDGLRPDYVTPDRAPAIYHLSERGTFFEKHHPVYLSATIVNGSAIATGCYPNRNGICANREYRPAINNTKPSEMALLDTIAKGDAASGGRYLAVPTIAELLQEQGKPCVVAAAKGVGILHNRNPKNGSVSLVEGKCLPADNQEKLIGALGAFPPETTYPKAAPNTWTTRALTEVLWAGGVPVFSVLWLSEPDLSQHATGVGSPTALAAIKSTDENVQRVLDALKEKGVLEKTDVYVVSDHGFSTVDKPITITRDLIDAGFKICDGKAAPQPGEIMMAHNGGSALFYLSDKDPAALKTLAAFLQSKPYAGVLMTRDELPGTFALKSLLVDTPDAPDLVLSFAWSDEKNEHGAPGVVFSNVKQAGVGNHASLSRWDMHNTLLAAGPSFAVRKSVTPSGNVDVAPTILSTLGVPAPAHMQGRVLKEALAGKEKTSPKVKESTATRPAAGEGWKFESEVKTSTVGGTTYIDWGGRR